MLELSFALYSGQKLGWCITCLMNLHLISGINLLVRIMVRVNGSYLDNYCLSKVIFVCCCESYKWTCVAQINLSSFMWIVL